MKNFLNLVFWVCIFGGIALNAGTTKVGFLSGRAPFDRRAEAGNLKQLMGEKAEIIIYDNRQLKEMSEALSGFDVVVFGTLANQVEPVSFMPYAAAWTDYLKSGKPVIILAASETTAYEEFFKILSWTGSVSSEVCALMGRFDLTSKIKYGKQEIINYPFSLENEFRKNNSGIDWAHTSVSGDWQTLAVCPDGQTLIAMREYGAGLVFFMVQAEYAGKSNLLKKMIENVLIYQKNRNAGISWITFDVSDDNGKVSMAFKNISSKPVEIEGHVIITAADGTSAKSNFKGNCGSSKNIDFSTNIDIAPGTSGILEIHMEKPVQWDVETMVSRQPMLQLVLPGGRIFPHQKSAFHIRAQKASQADKLKTIIIVEPESPVKIADAGNGTFVLNWEHSQPGEYTVRGQLLNADGSIYAETAPEKVIIDARTPYFKIDDKKRVVAGDQRIFPFGLYHVSWTLPPESRNECIDFAAANGYNAAHVSWRSGEDIAPLLKYAGDKGIWLFMEGVNLEKIAAFKDEKRILAWNIKDEPDLGNVDIGSLEKTYKQWLEVDPNHLIFTVLLFPQRFQAYGRIANLVGHDYYPILNGQNKRDISQVYANHARLRKETGDGRAPFAVLQCFGYKNGYGVPTPAEVRNMTYQAVLADTCGILFYAYNDTIFILKNNPELYQLMQELPKEINAITEFLLNGELKMLETGNEGVIAGQWTLGTKVLQIICNSTHQPVTAGVNGKKVELKALEVKVSQWTQGNK